MRIEPRPDRLIKRISDSLERDALAAMGTPLAARQLKAGLWALRRIASSPDFSEALLREDITDMEALLGMPQDTPTDIEAVRARHVALQDILVEFDRSAQTMGDGAKVRTLRDLYRRMLRRERGETAPARQDA